MENFQNNESGNTDDPYERVFGKIEEDSEPSSEESLGKIEAFNQENSPLKQRLIESLAFVLDRVAAPIFEASELVRDAIGFETGRERWADQERMAEDYKSFERLSDEAGEFFSDLIPRGVRKPEADKAGNRERNPVYYSELAKENLGVTRRFQNAFYTWKKDYRKDREKVLENTLFGKREPYEGEVRESHVSEGVVDQEHSRATYQGGGINIIHEKVRNRIDKSLNRSESTADLILQNVSTGEALNLNSLLPRMWEFSPSCLDRGLEEGGTSAAIDLKELEGADLREPRFSARRTTLAGQSFKKEILYGDLSEEGGVLSLCHEIAHAWQAEYLDKDFSGRRAFEDAYQKAFGDVFDLILLYRRRDKADFDGVAFEKVVKSLEAQGIELYYDAARVPFWNRSPVIEEGVVNIKLFDDPDTYCPVRSESLARALDGYVSDERDAWAHALKVMRFLRSKGVDIAPELTDLEKVKDVINPCLESYQQVLEGRMGPGDTSVFLRRTVSAESLGGV